ncbi:Ribonuclease Z [Marinomonas aquimarina]|uniref:Ribonuclease Z n=1 Tax=Marinomonas aquimarina TaxID=295068 RepID=A0A1A8T7Q1_9GAMM|nr:ribonuclease Z [Marinomonas aquimarina]SBS27226.1 Ribonuclease Z [Marinomonas aquimarina]
MEIDVLGSGSAFSVSRNTSSLLVTDSQQQRWLIDCGPTVPRALWQRDLSINDIEVMYFTHIHPDHCAGLPALLNRWKSFGRQAPLTIYCQAEHRPMLQQLTALATFPKAEIGFDIDWQDIHDHWTWRNWHLSSAATQHGQSNLSLRIEVDQRVLFYSGDGRPTPATINLMQNADLAFQECAVATSLADDASHGDVQSCLALAEQLDLSSLGLYHCYDEELPALTDAIAQQDNVFLSYDGLHIDLNATTPVIAQVQQHKLT